MLSEADVRKLIEREKNEKWVISNYKQLRIEYADQWVAAKDQKIVASGGSYKSLVADLKKRFGEYFCEVALEYVASKEPHMFMPR